MIRRTIAVLPLAFGLACGGEEAPREAPRPMAAAPAPEREANQPPVVERLRFDPAEPVPGGTVKALVTATDPDGDPLRIEFQWLRNGAALPGARQATFDGEALAKGDRLEVQVVASDGRLSSEPSRLSATLGNRAPFVQGVTITPARVRPGEEATALVGAGDADDDRVDFEYAWVVNGRETGKTERTFSTAGLKRGDEITVRVVVRDGQDRSRPVTSPALELANSPPVIRSVPAPRNQGGTFHYQFEAEDPDGDRNLRFRLEQAPSGMTIDPVLGSASFRPDPSQIGTHPVEIEVSDPAGDASTLRFNLAVNEIVDETPPARRGD